MYSRTDIPDDETISSFFPKKEDFSYMGLSSREIEDSSFSECNIQYGDLSASIIRRTEFISSDLANASFEASHQMGTTYDSSLLTGTSFLKSSFRKVTFSSCKGLYTVFSDIHAEEVLFEDSEFRESDFSHITGRKIVFRNCRLISCTFTGTMLKNLKLQDTTFEGLHISSDAHEARGARLSPANAIEVLSVLGVEVDMTL